MFHPQKEQGLATEAKEGLWEENAVEGKDLFNQEDDGDQSRMGGGTGPKRGCGK